MAAAEYESVLLRPAPTSTASGAPGVPWSPPGGVDGDAAPIGWGWVAALAVGIFALDWIGLRVGTLEGKVSPVWPAAGLGVWAVWRGGPRLLWGVGAGTLLSRPLMDVSLASSLGTTLGPVAEAWVGAALIGRLTALEWRWPKLGAPLGYVGAGVVGALLSALMGAAWLVGTGDAPAAGAGAMLLTWWLGDFFGVLLVVPLLDAWWLDRTGEAQPRRSWPWAGLALGSAAVVCGLAFFSPAGDIWLFAVFPPLLLGKHWWPRVGTSVVGLVIAVIAIVAAVQGAGPFAGGDLNSSLLRVHGFLGSVVLTALVLPVFRAYGNMRLPGTVLMLGWLVSSVVYSYQRHTVRLADGEHLQTEVANAEAAIVARIGIYTQALRAGEALFSTFGEVSHAQWRQFAQSLQLRSAFPGINGIGVIWPVTAEQRTAFVDAMRRNRGNDFVLRTVPRVTAPEPAAETPAHYVIGYIEPEAINEAAIGLDVGSEANRRAAAEAARDSGEARMTKRIVLVQDGQQRAGFLLYLPVYAAGRPLATVAERRAAFRHWIYAPFVTEAFLQGVLPGVTEEVDLDFFEGASTALPDLLYAGATPDQAVDDGHAEHDVHFDRITTIALAGETFTLGWKKSARFASPDATTPVWVGSGLALLSLALAGLVTVLQGASRHARALVAARTHELAEVNDRMEALLAMQQGLLDGNTFSIISVGVDGVIEYFNHGAERLLGYARDEMIGRTTPAVLHLPAEIEARAAALSRELRQPIAPGMGVFTALPERGRVDEREWTYRRKDGTEVPVLLTISALRDADGVITGFLGVAQDLTARKEAEASREAAVVELTALKQALDLHVEISVTDREGRIVYVNSRFCESSGYRSDELVGSTHRLLKSGEHPPEFFRGLWTTLLAGETWRGAVCNRSKSGRNYWLDTVIMPEFDEHGLPRRFVSIRTDITRRKEYEAGLSRARDDAMALSQLKSEFLANISHELRTPMNGVIGMAGLLAEAATDPEQQRMIEVIRSSGENLLTIINDILDLAKMESGKMRMVAAEFDLPRMLAETVELLLPRAEAAGNTLVCELGDGPRGAVCADEGRLRQVVLNLLGNALKFTRQGNVTLRLRQESVSGGRVQVRIEVEDTGCGIAPEMQARLFQPFVQVDGSATRAYGGTGLGLAISRQIVDLMGGRIGLQSTPGLGSTFWLEVTLAAGGATAPARPEARPEPAVGARRLPPAVAASAAAHRVLVVEDNAANRDVAGMQLRRLGHQVEFAFNGAAALEQLARQSFDLVLMDCQMPVLDGFAATRRIRSGALPGVDAHIPIIALTAYAMASDRERCLAAGMDDYLQKPIRPHELVATIARVLAARHAGGEGPVATGEDPRPPARSPGPEELAEDVASELEDIPAEDGGSIFAQVATDVLREIEAVRPDLEAMIVATNWTALGPLAHRLGGSAALFGGLALRAAFLDLERAAQASDRSDVQARWIVVQERFEALRAAVDVRLARSERVET